MLVKAGLPARATSQREAHAGRLGVSLGAGAGVAAAAAAFALFYRRRSVSG
jgi:nitrate reductase gamma subunit